MDLRQKALERFAQPISAQHNKEMGIEQRLKASYDTLIDGRVPQQFQSLLDRLDEQSASRNTKGQ